MTTIPAGTADTLGTVTGRPATQLAAISADSGGVSRETLRSKSGAKSHGVTSGSGAWLACQPAVRLVVAIQLGLAVLLLVELPFTGLTLIWTGALLPAIPAAVGIGIWALFTFSKSSRLEQTIGDVCGAMAMLFLLGLFVGPLQYVAIGLGRPFSDGWLTAVDASLGWSAKDAAAWLGARPRLSGWLTWGYVSLWWQGMAVIPALAILGLRQRIWEYVAVFHLASVMTLIGVALWPAQGPFTDQGFSSLLNQTNFVNQLASLKAGTLPPLVYGQLEGLVCFPSYHLAWAAMVTIALRRTVLFWPAVGLNLLLVGGTFLTGAHYLTDGLGTVIMLGGAYGLARYLSADRRRAPTREVFRPATGDSAA
jgi:hypothetical protein